MTAFNSFRNTYRVMQLVHTQLTYSYDKLLTLRFSSSFTPQKVLVLTKISRYEFEKLCDPSLDDSLLKRKLMEQGSDYEAVLDSHRRNKETEQRAVEAFKKFNIEYKIIDRLNINTPSVQWADLILPIGGDGTFLLGANLITDCQKPIMGINSDPLSSEGHLLLPPKYTVDIIGALERLKAGHYTFLMRSRIRTVLKGDNIWCRPSYLHSKGVVSGEERFYDQDEEPAENLSKERQLPWLALNEVFIGESHSARTSSLLINIDADETFHKIKSSGLVVSTGTGSTSWYKTINALNFQAVKDLFTVAKCNELYTDEHIHKITDDYNQSLQFSPKDTRLSYAIRDLIIHKKYRLPKSVPSHGFCNKFTVRSLSFDAGLVLDGGIAIPFHKGTTAILEIHKEDCLRNIVLLD